MKISKQILDHYIGYVTDWYVVMNDEIGDELTDYYDSVLRIKDNALNHQDLEPLKLGINYLLCHPEISLDNHGGAYIWDDEEVREILHYILSTIYPDNPKVNCEEVKDIQLVDMSKYDWWKSRGVKP